MFLDSKEELKKKEKELLQEQIAQEQSLQEELYQKFMILAEDENEDEDEEDLIQDPEFDALLGPSKKTDKNSIITTESICKILSIYYSKKDSIL